MVEALAQNTNEYSFQERGTSVNTTAKEIEKMLGMYLKMGLVQMAGTRMYWETETRYSPVADVMPRNRFQSLLTSLHFVNNMTVSETEKKDKLWKLRLWLDSFREKCLQVVPEEHNSVDEMMIPFKGKFSSIKQYMRGKLNPWGFKVWVRTGISGMMCDFDVYQGSVNGIRAKSELGLSGPSTNILTLSDKVNAFTKKLQRWAARAESGDFEMFSELHDFLESDMNANSLKESITCHLRSLLDKFNQYFLTENVEPFDWVRQPFTNCSSNNLPSELEDALIELSSDRTLQASFASKTLDEFWLSVVQEYPGLSKAAMDILTPFGSTYLCEKTFSSLAYIKNKYRCRLNSMEENLRVAVSSIDPRIDLLCSRKQAHPSH
ncbi:hypothetical protein NHX12_000523 [Muraenolepis orangiensis]|uniref:Transposase n=1 Tax=Muraenolepis orangiensis TaxID=630683 RepID=A0A9Q0I229_9TELE|nr:hypothetical protein NHX12_000523 [Muraenolepis orangiensis]